MLHLALFFTAILNTNISRVAQIKFRLTLMFSTSGGSCITNNYAVLTFDYDPMLSYSFPPSFPFLLPPSVFQSVPPCLPVSLPPCLPSLPPSLPPNLSMQYTGFGNLRLIKQLGTKADAGYRCVNVPQLTHWYQSVYYSVR